MPASPLVTFSNLIHRVDQHQVLTIDSLTLQAGERWCVFGGNGSGKSLLTALLTGQRSASPQSLVFADDFDPGRDICEVSFAEQQKLWQLDARHDVSEFNSSAFDAGTTVSQLINPQGQATAALREIMLLLHIGHLADKGIRFLSSGQLRRALLARALHQKPRLLILDHPLESIDRDSAAHIRHALQHGGLQDSCVLQLSRRQRDILPGTSHLAVMSKLRLVASGEVKEVAAMPMYREIVAGEKKRLESTVPKSAVLPGLCPGRSPALPVAGGPLIELKNVSAWYGEQCVFRGLSWQMWPGQHVLVEGPNGSGKSTLLGLIDGDNHKAYGQNVYLFGRRRGSGETIWEVKSRLGVVSNELHNRYIKGWRVLDVVVSGFFDSVGLYDDYGASEIACARSWLELAGITDLSRRYYHQLSFGEQRLVLLARAMVKSPLILILDEPCVGLDDYHRRHFLDILDLIAKGGRTHIIYVSHDDEDMPSCINRRLSFSRPDPAVPSHIEIQ